MTSQEIFRPNKIPEAKPSHKYSEGANKNKSRGKRSSSGENRINVLIYST